MIPLRRMLSSRWCALGRRLRERVRQEIEERTRRDVSIGAVYATLDRMETKGWVKFSMGKPSAELPESERKSLPGDLLEEFAMRGKSARHWYVRQLLTSIYIPVG